MSADLDVVYVVRRGERNQELLFSLRSLCNVPHRRVWIIGHKPRWVTGVKHVETIQRGTKWDNATTNLLAACDQDEISESFIYMNDDFFVLQAIDAVPVLHRGPVRDVLASYHGRSSSYTRGMAATLALLEDWGHRDPVSYELHVPMVMHRRRMRDVIDRANRDRRIERLHVRTLYGVVHRIGGARADDCKVFRPGHVPDGEPGTFLSSNDSSFDGRLRRWFIRRFPDPSPYER